MDLMLVLEIIAAVALLWALLLLLFFLLRPRDVPVRELIRIIPDVVRLIRSVVSDGKAPLDTRVVLVLLLVWIISPIDLIPEFIPVLGPLDDVVVAIVAMRYVRRRLGVDDLRARWPGTPAGFELLRRVIG
ncbi:MAG TPA: YkvA family protein [Candidatus Limnocylindria bacterium]|nr:YkvA family protein [Candidatus Limnocylindria bacterium]